MRDYLFRGKTEEGEWIEGYLIGSITKSGFAADTTMIIPVGEHFEFVGDGCEIYKCEPVNPETVGQWTGYADKNGRKIFEGDIVRTRKNGTRTEKLKGYFGVDSEGYPQRVPGYTGTSEYHYNTIVDCCAEVKYGWHGFYLEGTTTFVNAICNEVIGNIHDNPELVKGEGK